MVNVFDLKKPLPNLFTIIIGIETAKILAWYPGASISHQFVFRALTLELIKKGHQVTVITTNSMYLNVSTPCNLTEIDIGDVSYKILRDNYASTITGKQSDMISQVRAGLTANLQIFEKIFELDEIKILIKYRREDFDILLLEGFISPLLGLTYIFKIPTILVSSFGPFPGNYEIVGAPTHPTIYSEFFRQRIYNLSLRERVTQVLNHLRIRRAFSDMEADANILLRKIFGSDIPPLEDLKNNVDMLFLNVHPMWEQNHPVPPNVIFMGGLHQTLPMKLPQNFQDYLDRSYQGVIYISFGTNVNTSMLPVDKIEIFTEVFTQLRYNILWKWDSDWNFPCNAKNIKTFKWLPQADLLRHKNVKLFITQGGMQSTDEAITAGVPLVGIPMMADQWKNVEKYVHYKIGIKLDFEILTKEKLRNAIIEVAETRSYRNNIIRLRSLIHDQPQSPLERTIWWIEYVLRHGRVNHLRAPTANIFWHEFLELELGCFLASILVFIILVSMCFLKVMRMFVIFYAVKNFNPKLKKT